MTLLLQECDDPFQPRWHTLARVDLLRRTVEAEAAERPLFAQLREWLREGMLVIEDEETMRRVTSDDPAFVDLLSRRLGFNLRLVEGLVER